MKIAWELGKTEDEVLAFQPDEFSRWVAFFKIVAEENNKPRKKRGKGQASGN